jgi:hemerythrin-like domain-containing protein
VEKLSPNEPGFDGALEMLEAGISHHVKEEEEEVFPKFRKTVDSTELDQLGEQVAAAKDAAIPA